MKTLVLTTALLLSQVGHAELLNVQELNHKIQQQGGEWYARKNTLTDMNKQELKHRLGLRREGARDIQFITDSPKIMANLPAQFDWRNKDGQNWVSPILDQGNCGSCVAFASIGVLETQYKISSLLPQFNVKFSPQHLFACGGGACNWGWMPESAARYIQRNGVPDEACMPYISGATGQDVACRASCSDSAQRSFKISSYSSPTRGSQNLQALKQALLQGPVVTTLTVYADFMAYAGGVYKHTTGEYMGGHAISIIGYDDAKQAFIIRNSWGEEWGEKGFGYVAYDDESGVGDETWLYNIPAIGGAVSVESPADYSYNTGTVPVKVVSTSPSTDSMTVAVYNSQNQAVLSATCEKGVCPEQMDVSALPDGRYEVQVLAQNAVGEKLGTSERHFFYVVNQAPQMAITFKGKGSLDLNKDLKERIEVDITMTSSSVPMSSIEFHHVGPDGKDDVRTASVVPGKLTMGWRTNLVPNGKYDIWFVGHLKSNTIDTKVESAHLTVNVKN
ncbi:C1 family peptidase [Bdellovibrio sp. NC01]|uniref:C1 family peptidase n=1 Tax=Bdellovibrio sp. NC01 TaxID=2220073 RepID=UPI00143DAAE3|nr:C1 family peptidase [Bdellovibrio sp. NC01]